MKKLKRVTADGRIKSRNIYRGILHETVSLIMRGFPLSFSLFFFFFFFFCFFFWPRLETRYKQSLVSDKKTNVIGFDSSDLFRHQGGKLLGFGREDEE